MSEETPQYLRDAADRFRRVAAPQQDGAEVAHELNSLMVMAAKLAYRARGEGLRSLVSLWPPEDALVRSCDPFMGKDEFSPFLLETAYIDQWYAIVADVAQRYAHRVPARPVKTKMKVVPFSPGSELAGGRDLEPIKDDPSPYQIPWRQTAMDSATVCEILAEEACRCPFIVGSEKPTDTFSRMLTGLQLDANQIEDTVRTRQLADGAADVRTLKGMLRPQLHFLQTEVELVSVYLICIVPDIEALHADLFSDVRESLAALQDRVARYLLDNDPSIEWECDTSKYGRDCLATAVIRLVHEREKSPGINAEHEQEPPPQTGREPTHPDSLADLQKPDGWTKRELVNQAKSADLSCSATTFDSIRKVAEVSAGRKGDTARRFSSAELRKMIRAAETGRFRDGNEIARAWGELLPPTDHK